MRFDLFHHFDRGDLALAQRIVEDLAALNRKVDSIMATLAEFQEAFTAIDTATTEISADIQSLVDQLAAGGGLTTPEEQEALDKLRAVATRLQGIAASVETPVPPPVV